MRCLSVQQPYASFIIEGYKTIECRTWPTNIRERIAIHASKPKNPLCKEVVQDYQVKEVMDSMGYTGLGQMPTGVILGTVEIYNCIQAEEIEPSHLDKLLGWWGGDKQIWCWLLIRPERTHRVPCPGSLGLFSISDEKERMLTEP